MWPRRSTIEDPAGAQTLAYVSFAIAGVGVAALLCDLRKPRYKRTVTSHIHGFSPMPADTRICVRCKKDLGLGNHRPLRCKCPWRVADERCICSRARDRYQEASCPYCRDGQHFTETLPAIAAPA